MANRMFCCERKFDENIIAAESLLDQIKPMIFLSISQTALLVPPPPDFLGDICGTKCNKWA